MRERWLALGCLVAAACGGSDGAGPTTSHDLVGSWSYDMPDLQDGHGLTCTISGPVLALAQSGVAFSGNVSGGTEACMDNGTPFGGNMESAVVLDGRIQGDSVSFYVESTIWRSVGTLVTEDSMAGIVNAFTSYQGTQRYLVGHWYSKRQ